MKSTIISIIILTLKLTGQKFWWFMKNWGIFMIAGGILGSILYHNSADYRIKNFEITFMDMLLGKKTPEDSSRAVSKMISGATNPRECITAVEAMTETLKMDKYNPADVITVADKQFYKDCQ